MGSNSGKGMSRREFLRQAATGAAAVAAAGAVGSGLGWGAESVAEQASPSAALSREAVRLPRGVKAVWDLSKAYQESTPTRAEVCINGLWRWQPATQTAEQVPSANWGYFKVPGCWPGVTDYMQVDCQTVYTHPGWAENAVRDTAAAWYERQVTVPNGWTGRRVALRVEYLNSYAAVYLDGAKVGELRFPGGDLDLTSACRPGNTYTLSLLVVAMPLQGVMLSYSDTASAKEVKGEVQRRGLCGDIYLVSTPSGAHIDTVKVDTSVRKGELTIAAGVQNPAPGASYTLHAEISDHGRRVHAMTSAPFGSDDLKQGRFAFTSAWKPDKLWDTHTPQNVHEATLTLLDHEGKVLDTALPVRFGYREFWIEGRDFYLNGIRIFLSAVTLENAEVGAAAATYEGARESMERLKTFGINFVYGGNYGCEPGTHLGFTDILRAADDVGMLVAFSQPHFGQYDWKAPDADRNNGYARHAAFYVRAAGNHPSVVAYSMSHNGCGYSEDMNPDLIDGIHAPRDRWSQGNAARALRAQAIVAALDPSRIIYHHASGNLGCMHDVNFYPNWVPMQEMSDWLEHWATEGVKPFFTCEYGVPFMWDWSMYRGWYNGKRTFGSAVAPWEFCLAEWDAQFLGDRSYALTEMERKNLRWEAQQFREGKLWHRWDYPYQLGSSAFKDQHTVNARYITDNWRAFRTWGLSANSPWDYSPFWTLREGAEEKRRDLPVDWSNLQRPGFSPDYIDRQFHIMDLSFERSDWIPNADARALMRNNMALLAYIAGKPARFTSKDHNFLPGEMVEKQLILINNSREPVACEWEWSAALPQPASGRGQSTVAAGDQKRLPLRLPLPGGLAPGIYRLHATATFSTGERQEDDFAIHVLPRPAARRSRATIALFDPQGETGKLLAEMGVHCQSVPAGADLSRYAVLVIGKGALTVDGPGPDLRPVRDGLKVVVFEQVTETLEKRLGFRVTEYGLRQVYPRVPDHPLLSGVPADHLRDWRGEATLLPPRLKYETSDDVFNGAPTVKWCDIPVTRLWRCGNRGNVASALIEKPARGNFLPLTDGGFSLQYSPLLEYREGKGLVLFCQMDVTGRSEDDPAAQALVRRIVAYVSEWKAGPSRQAVYVGDAAGRRHFEASGASLGSYPGGELTADHVLIVGPGGGRGLTGQAAAIGAWLREGGNLLSIGLDEAEASAFLPFRVSTRRQEHIAAFFEPFPADSLLAGVGSADTMNRDPRELPLVSGGAQIAGNGVLAVGESAKVVFCQLAPWQFDYPRDAKLSGWGAATPQMNLKRTYRRTSFLVNRLLANLGVNEATPLLSRFSQPLGTSDSEKRWLAGLYLDQPEEWDDPYRHFRW